jgi:glucose/arabinose dehydrogenase
MRRLSALALATASAGLIASAPARAASPTLALKLIVTLDAPVALATRHADKAVWIAEQGGQIVRVDGKTVEKKLNISSQLSTDSEQGLLGIAFSPDGRHLYVDATVTDGTSIVWEYIVSPNGRLGTRRVVLKQTQPYANHNGGNLVLGPDGYLYVGFGDGGSGGDPGKRAQDKSTWLGKILRIDPAHRAGGKGYSVPSGNPFVHTGGARPEIWLLGVRNPWRFEFDRANGDLWIGDVGQDKYEEVDHLKATNGRNAGRGVNLGWSAYEGNHAYDRTHPLSSGATRPVFDYTHDHGCAITGGFVYRGSRVPALRGRYVFSDYCSGGLRTTSGTLFEDTGNVTSFGQGPDSELWVLTSGGQVSKIIAG